MCMQENDQVTAKLERHRAEAQGLERQVVAIGEEVRRKDEAQRQELLACQEALQQVGNYISQRNPQTFLYIQRCTDSHQQSEVESPRTGRCLNMGKVPNYTNPWVLGSRIALLKFGLCLQAMHPEFLAP